MKKSLLQMIVLINSYILKNYNDLNTINNAFKKLKEGFGRDQPWIGKGNKSKWFITEFLD